MSNDTSCGIWDVETTKPCEGTCMYVPIVFLVTITVTPMWMTRSKESDGSAVLASPKVTVESGPPTSGERSENKSSPTKRRPAKLRVHNTPASLQNTQADSDSVRGEGEEEEESTSKSDPVSAPTEPQRGSRSRTRSLKKL